MKKLVFLGLAVLVLVHSTVAVWTQKPFTPLLTRPQGSQGCQKIRIYFLQIKVLSSCAKIAQKRHKLQKSSKLKKKCQKNPVFLDIFEYSSIWGQSQRTKPYMACLVDPGASFDTPGTPGSASIVEISAFQYLFLIFLYDSATWRIFFTILKLKPDVTFINLTCIKVAISLFIARMAGFSK